MDIERVNDLHLEAILKKYENCGITHEEYVRLRALCNMPPLIEGEIVDALIGTKSKQMEALIRLINSERDN